MPERKKGDSLSGDEGQQAECCWKAYVQKCPVLNLSQAGADAVVNLNGYMELTDLFCAYPSLFREKRGFCLLCTHSKQDQFHLHESC